MTRRSLLGLLLGALGLPAALQRKSGPSARSQAELVAGAEGWWDGRLDLPTSSPRESLDAWERIWNDTAADPQPSVIFVRSDWPLDPPTHSDVSWSRRPFAEQAQPSGFLLNGRGEWVPWYGPRLTDWPLDRYEHLRWGEDVRFRR